MTALFQVSSALQAAFAAFSCQCLHAQHLMDSSIRSKQPHSNKVPLVESSTGQKYPLVESSTGCVHNLQVMHCSFTQLVAQSFIHSFTWSLLHSLIQSLMHAFVLAFIHSFIHSFTQSVSQEVSSVRCGCSMCRLFMLMQLSAKMVCVCPGQTECCCSGKAQMLEGYLLCLLGVWQHRAGQPSKAVPATHWIAQ